MVRRCLSLLLLLVCLPCLADCFATQKRTSSVSSARPQQLRPTGVVFMSSETSNNKPVHDDTDNTTTDTLYPPSTTTTNLLQRWWSTLQTEYAKRPPFQVDDLDIVLYDIFLLLNLVLSIDFWVVHRMQLASLPAALNEGCLLSLCWLTAGLWTGAFLYSAVDGHYATDDQRAGPPGAARLALHTMVNAINVRLLLELGAAVLQHRPALENVGNEALLPLELGLGLVLMPMWRLLHSSYTPRL